jgi:hypothetical protein
MGATGEKLEIPEPGLLILMKVKDDTLFNFAEQQMKSNPQATSSDKEGLKIRSIPFGLPLPIELNPSVGRSGDYLFVATSEVLIEQAVGVKTGKTPGLKSTAEFKRLSQGIPEQGNHFAFVSELFSKSVAKIQLQALQQGASKDPVTKELFQNMFGAKLGAYSYLVNSNTPDGWVSAMNTNVDFSKMIAMQGAMVPGILAGIALPSFTRARARSQAVTVLNEARQLDGAKDQHLLSADKAGAPTFQDLKQYLRQDSPLLQREGKDPLGGTYILGDEFSVRVDPKTKEALQEATGGDAFWGPYS